jgi:hypothetical protein
MEKGTEINLVKLFSLKNSEIKDFLIEKDLIFVYDFFGNLSIFEKFNSALLVKLNIFNSI